MRKESLAGALAFQLCSRRGRCRATRTDSAHIGAAGACGARSRSCVDTAVVGERPAQSHTAALTRTLPHISARQVTSDLRSWPLPRPPVSFNRGNQGPRRLGCRFDSPTLADGLWTSLGDSGRNSVVGCDLGLPGLMAQPLGREPLGRVTWGRSASAPGRRWRVGG